jgi:hypothetical protein
MREGERGRERERERRERAEREHIFVLRVNPRNHK